MKTIKMILISILLVLSGATSAHAMGDREKGALLGAGAVILLGNLIGRGQESTTRYVETPVYYEQRPRVVYREPYYERERVIIIDNSPRHRPRHHDYYDRRGYYR